MPIANEATELCFLPLAEEDNAVGETRRVLRGKVRKELETPSVYWDEANHLMTAQLQLRSLARLRSNWDSYGAPSPNSVSINNARRILGLMKPSDLNELRIVPSAEGGVGFCFAKMDRYADIEASNDGDVIGVKYVGREMPVVLETDGTNASIEAALEKIRDHIRA